MAQQRRRSERSRLKATLRASKSIRRASKGWRPRTWWTSKGYRLLRVWRNDQVINVKNQRNSIQQPRQDHPWSNVGCLLTHHSPKWTVPTRSPKWTVRSFPRSPKLTVRTNQRWQPPTSRTWELGGQREEKTFLTSIRPKLANLKRFLSRIESGLRNRTQRMRKTKQRIKLLCYQRRLPWRVNRPKS